MRGCINDLAIDGDPKARLVAEWHSHRQPEATAVAQHEWPTR